ncbi:hypothetical protein C7957_103102 [Halanaerobium saccharolyticum]|uniref:Uncharacterized protein n=1 Tax=Halanaerobium saccharolyticum TaxID=43595 RepID=A0A4R6SJ69_9FIRM|nr:MAG: hypothetical protein CI949_1651 [Halanaerobium sp.]TDQ01697.1 hypothetical protein C7957_103102 [Halanaerobium saccharolyticum]
MNRIIAAKDPVLADSYVKVPKPEIMPAAGLDQKLNGAG